MPRRTLSTEEALLLSWAGVLTEEEQKTKKRASLILKRRARKLEKQRWKAMPDDTRSHAGSSTIPVPAVLEQLDAPQWRDAFVGTRVRSRIALLIRALREQRGWSQADLGQATGKPQSNISKFEDPDYGKFSLTTLFEFAAAFGLPLYIDMPEWEEWFELMSDQPTHNLQRHSFDKARLSMRRERENSRGR